MRTNHTSKGLRPSRGGLTLIEMLIVIAIIAILASMFMPSILKIREEARKQACMNQLREIGLNTLLYRDSIGRGSYYPTGGQGLFATQRGADFSAALYDPQGLGNDDPSIYACPSQPMTETAWSLSRDAVETSYAGWTEGVGLAIHGYLGEIGIVADWDESKTSNHADGVNVLFADGHVSFMRWGSMQRMDRSQVGDPTARRMQRTDFNAEPELITLELRGLTAVSQGDPETRPAPVAIQPTSTTLTTIVLEEDETK